MNKAFLKWAGGKSSSVQMIATEIGAVRGRFVEPFVGSAVVALNIYADSYILGDYNADLINLYQVIKEHGERFAVDCYGYFTPDNNTADKYYEHRERFNTTTDSYEKAILFLYLNRHCFNGLCRYNKSGGFNVPFGKYRKPYYPSVEITSFITRAKKCEFVCQSFEDTIRQCEKGDIIYCDPPYVPLSETAYFTSYSVDGFTKEQQELLAQLAEESDCKVLISNHDTAFTRKLYRKADKIITKDIQRYISGKGANRKAVKELLAVYEKE
jgi:DNA adenine methylase